MNPSNTTNMSFRVDKKLKKQADLLFRNLGLNMSVALNMFLVQCVREQGLPFTPTMETKAKSNGKDIMDDNLINQGNIEDLL